MRRTVLAVSLVVFAGWAESNAADLDPTFIAMELPITKGKIPPCTPVITEVQRNGLIANVRDQNGTWGRLQIAVFKLEAKQFSDFGECLEAVPEYAGRYTDEHVDLK